MKKSLSIILRVLGAVVGLVVVGALVFVFGLRPRSRPARDLKASSSEEVVRRGEYLATHVAICPACHADSLPFRGAQVSPDRYWIGRDVGADMKANGLGLIGGGLTATNLTPSSNGIRDWSDGELLRAIRDGISRDGRALFPMMPYREYAATLSDDDVLAIVAYLRSLPPSENGPKPSRPSALPKLIGRLVALPAADVRSPAPGSADYGKWLLGAALCGHCHNSEKASPDAPDYAGGQESSGLVTPNITSDPVFGIGTYTEADIVRVLEGTKKDGSTVREMPTYLYKGLSDDDKLAIAKAVKAIPPAGTPPK